MRKAEVFNNGVPAGEFIEFEKNKNYKFTYYNNYSSSPISLTMPVAAKEFHFNSFPPFFEGLLPEGIMLDSLLRTAKIDADDYFTQLMYVGGDLVGSVTVKELL